MIATLADFGLAFLVIWLMGMPLSMGMTGGEVALAALFGAIAWQSVNIASISI